MFFILCFTRSLPLISVGVDGVVDGLPSQEYLQCGLFVGGDGVVFVKQNNIFYRPSFNTSTTVYQVTSTGVPGTIYNGVADWLYEGELEYHNVLTHQNYSRGNSWTK